MEVEETREIKLRDDEILGQYLINGILYFQGDYHEDLILLRSCTHQVSLMDEDGEPHGWIDCEVLNYDASEKVYEVKFSLDDSFDTAFVNAADIRIKGPSPPKEFSDWKEVQQDLVANDTTLLETSEEKYPKQALEYYKGVIVADEFNRDISRQTQEDEKISNPVSFRKRTRPGKA